MKNAEEINRAIIAMKNAFYTTNNSEQKACLHGMITALSWVKNESSFYNPVKDIIAGRPLAGAFSKENPHV